MPNIWFAGSEACCFKGTFTVGGVYDNNCSRGAIVVSSNQSAALELKEGVGENSLDGWWLNFKLAASGMGRVTTYPPGLFFKIFDKNFNAFITTAWPEEGYVNFSLTIDENTVTTKKIAFSGALIPYNFHCYTKDSKAYLDIYVNEILFESIYVANKSNPSFLAMCFSSPGGFVWEGFGHWSEFILSDFNNIGLRTQTYYASADGYYNEGIGSYADVASATYDGKAIILPEINQKKSIKFTKHGTGVYGPILGMCVNGNVTTNNESDLRYGLRINNNDYYSDNLNCDFTLNNRSWVLPNNPNNNVPWGITLPADLELIMNSVARV